MTKPWKVRRDKINPRFPWVWFCEGRVREGLVDRPCPGWGPTSTEAAAHASALEHALDVHGYNPEES